MSQPGRTTTAPPAEAPGAWMRDGLCTRSSTPDLWFPEAGQRDVAAAAKAICAVCPVQTDCLAYAVATGIRHGVWGGTSLEERDGRKQRRQLRPAGPATRARKTKAERDRRQRLRHTAAARMHAGAGSVAAITERD